MTDLQELIELANKLCKRLEIAASDEQRFCTDICMKLESMAWEVFRHSNDLSAIKHYIS
jgi:hypothetical protein